MFYKSADKAVTLREFRREKFVFFGFTNQTTC